MESRTPRGDARARPAPARGVARRRGASLALSALLAAPLGVAGAPALWEDVSFAPPFKTFSPDGMRQVPGFRASGVALVNENFLRLTPDRQSKRGGLWATTRLEGDRAETWSATLRFRTSGQGQRLFGDGVAFWATTSASAAPGELLGFTPSFKGFGVVLDTFVNSEPGHAHKDVQIVSSDGSGPVKLDDKPTGCDADFRYWEGRDDFTVANHSALRVRFAGGRVAVHIDARGTGEWRACIADAPVRAPPGWARDGLFLGLTASTGDLADNHDVLSLGVAAEDEPAPPPPGLVGIAPGPSVEFRATGDPKVDDAIRSAAAAEAGVLLERLALVQHALEHELASITESLKAAVKRVEGAEADVARRVEEIERRLAIKVDEKLAGKLDDGVASRLNKLDGVVAAAVDSATDAKVRALLPGLEKSAAARAAAGGAGWLGWAVGALFLLVLALAGAAYAKYRQMRKTHLL